MTENDCRFRSGGREYLLCGPIGNDIAEQALQGLEYQILEENYRKDKKRIADPPVSSHKGTEQLERRTLQRGHDEKIIAAGEVIEDCRRRDDDAKVQNGIPQVTDGGMKPAGKKKSKRVKHQHSVPDEAVDAHEIPERICGPVREDQCTDCPGHQQYKPDFTESPPKREKPLRQKCLQQIDENGEAAQVKRQVGQTHAVNRKQKKIPEKISGKKRQGGCF